MSDEVKIVTRICITVVIAISLCLGGCMIEKYQERAMADKGYVWTDAQPGYQKK